MIWDAIDMIMPLRGFSLFLVLISNEVDIHAAGELAMV